jgi:hypothetical protein
VAKWWWQNGYDKRGCRIFLVGLMAASPPLQPDRSEKNNAKQDEKYLKKIIIRINNYYFEVHTFF